MKQERFVIIQFPNRYLWAMIASSIVGYFTEGAVRSFSQTVFYFAVIIWAYEEIVHGVNWFRKLLGLSVMAWEFFRIFTILNRME